MKICLYIVVFCFGLMSIHAQDIHWTQFNDNPIFLNPAQSGNFTGDHRFIGNFRDQWRAVTKAFQTFSVSYDTKLKNPNFGLGVCLFHDQDGDGKFKTVELEVNPSYRLMLSKDSLHQLRVGAQFALNHRQFQFNQFYFDEQYNGTAFDPNIPNTESLTAEKRTTISLGSGFVYSYQQDKRRQFSFGLAALNINQPNQGFYGFKVQRDLRLTAFARYSLRLSERLDLLPTALFQHQGTYREFLIGGQVKYHLNPDLNDYKALNAGLMFRNRDAFFFVAGLDYHLWYFGVSYDVNVSTLRLASNGRGGLELSVRYIIHRFKPKKIQHRICPEFI